MKYLFGSKEKAPFHFPNTSFPLAVEGSVLMVLLLSVSNSLLHYPKAALDAMFASLSWVFSAVIRLISSLEVPQENAVREHSKEQINILFLITKMIIQMY